MNGEKRLVRDLPVNLTQSEVLERGERLALLLKEETAVELERKEVARGYKQRIDELHKKQLELAQEIRTHEATRPIECVERESARGLYLIEIVRLDTGAVVDERVMEDVERQHDLFDRNVSAALHAD